MKKFIAKKDSDKDHGTIEDGLTPFVVGDKSLLGSMSGVSDVQSLSSFSNALSEALATAIEEGNTEGISMDEKQSRLQKRKKVSKAVFVVVDLSCIACPCCDCILCHDLCGSRNEIKTTKSQTPFARARFCSNCRVGALL